VPWSLGAFASGTREEGVEVAGGRMSGGSWLFVFAVLLVLVLVSVLVSVLVLALALLVLLLVEMFLGLPYHRYCMDDGE
jgi:hypothetical protein